MIDRRAGAPGRKITDMVGVRSYGNEPQVELWLNEQKRLVIVAYNEAGYAATEVDLWDILDWLQAGPGAQLVLDTGPSACASPICRIDSEEK